MKTFQQFTEEYKGRINWIAPDANSEHDEVEHQLTGHKETPFLPDWAAKRMSQLSNKDEWNKAIKKGKPKDFSRQDLRKVGNTESWESLDKDKKQRAPTLYGADKKVQRPIILRNPETGEHHLIAGNTRSAYTTQVLGHPVSAHVIE
jgi:hypothetical protein